MVSCVSHLQYIWNRKGTEAEMCPAIICGIINGDATNQLLANFFVSP